MTSAAPLTGACACGGLRLQLTPPTTMCGHCHCASCRRAHAAAFVTWTAVPSTRFAWLAPPATLSRYSSSPGVVRSFCGRCGTQVRYDSEDHPGKVYVPLAILDGEIDRAPEAHVNVAESVHWSALPDDGVPRFDRFD